MRKITTLLFVGSIFTVFSQEWAFMKGSLNSTPPVPSSNVPSSPGTYASGNAPANREHGHAAMSGNKIYLYGGANGGNGGVGSDLWVYDIDGTNANNWRYIAQYGGSPDRSVIGSESASVHPGPLDRGATSADAQGNIWIFGGLVPGTITKDLWKFNVTTELWTYYGGDLGGNTNWPDARYRVRSWFDSSGNLWIFGGSGASGSYNDLWKFNPSTQSWTAINPTGSNNLPIYNSNQQHSNPNPSSNGSPTYSGSYNGVGNVGLPAARSEYGYWISNSGVLYIFAGYAVSHQTNLGDFWKYDPNQTSGGQWTLLGGDGTIGNSLPGTAPSERDGPYCWKDNDGKFHLFGGANSDGFIRDMWQYDPVANTWSQEGTGYNYNAGNNDGPSYQGTMAQNHPNNKPGAQICASSHITNGTHTYMLDGFGSGQTAGGYCTTGNGCGLTGMVNRLSLAAPTNVNPSVTVSVLQDNIDYCSSYSNDGLDNKILQVTNSSSVAAQNVKVKISSNINGVGTTLTALSANQIQVVNATTNVAIPFTLSNSVVWERGTYYPSFPCASSPNENWEEVIVNIPTLAASQSVKIIAQVEHCNCNLNYEPTNFNVWNGLTHTINFENLSGQAMTQLGPTESPNSWGWWWTDTHTVVSIPTMVYGDNFVFTSNRVGTGGINSNNPFITNEQNVRCKLDVLLPECFVLNSGDLTDITATDVNGTTYNPTSYSILNTLPNGDQHMEFLFPVLPGKVLNQSISMDLRVFYNTQNCSQNPIEWKMWFVPDYTCAGITEHCWLPATASNISATQVSYTPVGLEKLKNEAVSVFPNPSNGIFNVVLSNSSINNQIESMKVTDLNGKEIYLTNNISHNQIVIDLKNEIDGVYLLEIITSNGNFHSTLIKK